MLTKQHAQLFKLIREFFDLEWPLLKKRVEILELGNERQFHDNLLTRYSKSARFVDENTDMHILLIGIDMKLSKILEILTKEK